MRISIVLLFVLINISCSLLYAQTEELNQLLAKAENSKGLEKIRTLAEISKYYYSIDPNTGIEYANKALQLSEMLKISSEKAKIYNNIAVNYFVLNQLDSSKLFNEKALATAMLSEDSLEMGIAYTGIGLFFEKKGEFDSCLVVFHKALTIFKQIHNEERIGRILDNLGTIHQHKGEYKTSLTYFLQANNSYEKSGYIKNLPYLYLKLGWVFSETADYATAAKWYNKGKKRSLESKDFQTAGIAINAIGVMYKNQGKYDEALKNYLEVIPIADKINNKRLLLAVYGNIGNVYQSMGLYKNAVEYFQKSLNIAMLSDAPVETAIQQVNLGITYNFLKDYQKAILHLEKALPVFLKANTSSYLLSTYDALIIANNGLKRFEFSVKYYEKYSELKDSLYQNELNTALDSLKVQFNTEQTEKENTLLSQRNEIQTKTISLQRNMIVSAIIISFLLIGFVVMIFRNRQKIRKANILLEDKNIEISAKAEELKQINQKLTELSHFKDSLNSFLVHDLKNPLNKLLSINNKSSFEENIEAIKQTGLQMLHIVSNILDINKYEGKTMILAIQNKSISQIINEAYVQTRYFADQKSIHIALNFSRDYIVKVDSEIIIRVLVNLLTNSIKFSHNGGKIMISAEIKDQRNLKLTVTDEGEGIPADYQTLIFDKYSQAKVRHLGFAGSTGIGLNFCKIAVESHGGTIGVISEIGQGASFWFTIPFITNLECLPEDLDIISKDKISLFRIDFNKEEISHLKPYYSILKNTSIYQISDIKEILNRIEKNTDNIAKWKCLILQALNECNEVKYLELLKTDTYESN